MSFYFSKRKHDGAEDMPRWRIEDERRRRRVLRSQCNGGCSMMRSKGKQGFCIYCARRRGIV